MLKDRSLAGRGAFFHAPKNGRQVSYRLTLLPIEQSCRDIAVVGNHKTLFALEEAGAQQRGIRFMLGCERVDGIRQHLVRGPVQIAADRHLPLSDQRQVCQRAGRLRFLAPELERLVDCGLKFLRGLRWRHGRSLTLHNRSWCVVGV